MNRLFVLLLFLAACAPGSRLPTGGPGKVPFPPPIAPPAPRFEKTFGSVAVGPGLALVVRYKSITLTVDPNSQGAWEIKGPKSSGRSMLKSGDDFVFLTVPRPHIYLLEYDNGRNLLIAGDTADPDSLRDFVYDLRDDGKEIYAGFFAKGPGGDDASLAKTIGLIQPQIAILAVIGGSAVNETVLRESLKSEFFEGPAVILKTGDEIPF